MSRDSTELVHRRVLTEKREKSRVIVSDHSQCHSILVGICFKESKWKSESFRLVAVLDVDLGRYRIDPLLVPVAIKQ